MLKLSQLHVHEYAAVKQYYFILVISIHSVRQFPFCIQYAGYAMYAMQGTANIKQEKKDSAE